MEGVQRVATTSVQNAFLVLETVADLQPAGLTAVARAAGMPKSTTQRMLLTLAEVGWLRATDDSPTRWVLTYRALRVGGQVDGRHGLRESALPEMSALQHATTETVHLTAPDGDDELVETLEGEWHGTQTVLLEFESVEAAKEWYYSDAYQEAVKLRQAAADCNGAIISGF